MTSNQIRTSVLTAYAAHFYRTKPKMSPTEMIAIANEISNISEILPIFWLPQEYKPQEINNAITSAKKNHKIAHIIATDDNYFVVKNIPGKMSPNKLVAFWEYLLDTISKGNLSTHPGFEHLKTAKILAK